MDKNFEIEITILYRMIKSEKRQRTERNVKKDRVDRTE